MGADASKSSQTAVSRNEQASCANIKRLNLEKQMNAHAAEILAACGHGSAQLPVAATKYTATNFTSLGRARPHGVRRHGRQHHHGRRGTFPHVTRSETFRPGPRATRSSRRINDSRLPPRATRAGRTRSTTAPPGSNLNTRPFCSGHGTGYGDPVIVLRPDALEVDRGLPRLRLRRPGPGRLDVDQ